MVVYIDFSFGGVFVLYVDVLSVSMRFNVIFSIYEYILKHSSFFKFRKL